MAYNLQPLITNLEQILNPDQTLWIVDHNKPQLQSLLQKATSLLQILDKSLLTKIESLESQIRDAAHKAEDMIESHMVDQMLSNPKAVSFTFITPDLQQVTQELDSVMEQVVKLVEVKTASSGGSSSGASFSGNVDSVKSKAMVGVDADLMKLKDRVMGMQSKLEIMPIVGMGGIGKTTLALKLYQDPSIVEHFTSLAWATVSQDYNMKAILLSLLRCISGKESDKHAEKESDELKDILYRSLYGRRYMIVLDDIWSIKFWDEIRMYLPDSSKGSRIVITTRESEVAKHASSQSVHHHMQLLNASESWNLLREIVFGGDDDCPHELKAIGENIARDCGGLPLAISVIGGLLSKVERSKDVWENIANNVASAIAEADKQFSNILSLSYSHLPNQLKPCFLYMGALREDSEVPDIILIRLWIAEGFVKSMEVAEDCLKALVERNLFMVGKYKYEQPQRYKMHDLLRDLCIRKSNEEKFLYHVKSGVRDTFSNQRRVCVDTSSHEQLEDDSALAESISLVRSFIGVGEIYKGGIQSCAFFQSRLLKALIIGYMKFKEFPTETFELVNLRFLFVLCDSRIPSGISRLKNLQTLIVDGRGSSDMTSEILEMSELRYLYLNKSIEIDEEGIENIVPNKLQFVNKIRLTESLIRKRFLESIPDIKDLGILCDFVVDDPLPNTIDLTHLQKLETLTIYCPSLNAEAQNSLHRFKFPRGLRKLALHKGVISRRVKTALSALPNLEVLKMDSCEFEKEGTNEEVWEVGEGVEFPSLQFLYLKWLNLVRWTADETNFPRLRHLRLKSCYELEEIPSGVGEIPTLQSIELDECSDSAVASAKRIVEEQQSDYGNYDIQLHIKLAE